MDMLLKFGIGADSSTFGLPGYATPLYQMGFFETGVAENLGLNKGQTKFRLALIFSFYLVFFIGYVVLSRIVLYIANMGAKAM